MNEWIERWMVEWVKKVCEPILQRCKLRSGGEGRGDCLGDLGWGWNPSVTLVLCSLPADHGSSDRVGARSEGGPQAGPGARGRDIFLI